MQANARAMTGRTCPDQAAVLPQVSALLLLFNSYLQGSLDGNDWLAPWGGRGAAVVV